MGIYKGIVDIAFQILVDNPELCNAMTLVEAKESPACRKGLTNYPAYDIFVSSPEQRKGKHLFTVICF